MKISITQRFFWAIMLAAGLAVISLVWITQWNLKRGFLRFIKETERAGIVRLTDSLQDFYAAQGSWRLLRENPETWRTLILLALPNEIAKWPPPPAGQREGKPPAPSTGEKPGKKPLPPRFMERLIERVFLLDSAGDRLIGPAGSTEDMDLTPLTHGGELIGYLGYRPLEQITEDRHLLFLKEQKLAYILVAGIIVLLSGLLSLLLARRLVRPLANLAQATHTLTGGDFSCRVPVTGTDELGKLASDFNLLALTLDKNEQARRQWVADISHELRTPIGILRGEIEALQDGVRKPNGEALQSLQSETLRLSRLVDDLYQLTMSDLGALSYRKSALDIAALLEDLAAVYREDFRQRSLRLSFNRDGRVDGRIFGDPERLRQLFSNLFDNSLKYTDAGGALEIELGDDGAGNLLIGFQDTAPAVAASELEKLFDRLYRIESSRNRETGGAGLGLALCRNIVEAHQGTISAHASPLGGLLIRIALPLPEKRQ